MFVEFCRFDLFTANQDMATCIYSFFMDRNASSEETGLVDEAEYYGNT